MSEFQGIWVIAEVSGGKMLEATEELMTPARRLGDKLGQPVTGVILGGGDTSQMEALFGQMGADQVIVAKDDRLADYQVELYTKALADLVSARKPGVVLAAATSNCLDYFPRVAVRTNAGLVTNAIDLDLTAENRLDVSKACFAESLLESVVVEPGRTQMVAVKKKAFPKPVADGSRSAQVETVTPDLGAVQPRTKLVSVEQATSKGKKLEDADIVVSGGRGLKEAENFRIVEELAEALGAAVGASRAVVDAGWRPHSEQVGQTGKSVSPKVYFALGISGAIQHQVGMNASQIIIAINRDENAPIFKLADFGIVGDAVEIVPELTRTIKEQNLVLNV